MLHAVLICSDAGCAERFEADGSLEELDALICDCDCALVIVALSESDASGATCVPAA